MSYLVIDFDKNIKDPKAHFCNGIEQLSNCLANIADSTEENINFEDDDWLQKMIDKQLVEIYMNPNSLDDEIIDQRAIMKQLGNNLN